MVATRGQAGREGQGPRDGKASLATPPPGHIHEAPGHGYAKMGPGGLCRVGGGLWQLGAKLGAGPGLLMGPEPSCGPTRLARPPFRTPAVRGPGARAMDWHGTVSPCKRHPKMARNGGVMGHILYNYIILQ